MIETPSAAFRQSSRDRRSPMTNSTYHPAGNRSGASFQRDKRLDGRTKQRRLPKPYSRSFSTTFEPIKPLDPVTRMQSDGEAIYSRFISRREINTCVPLLSPWFWRQNSRSKKRMAGEPDNRKLFQGTIVRLLGGARPLTSGCG